MNRPYLNGTAPVKIQFALGFERDTFSLFFNKN